MAIELELKLMVHPEHLKLASEFLDQYCATTTASSRQTTLALMNGYYDTPESLLRESGIALRIRAVNQDYIQTVKTRGSSRVGMHARGEWEWSLPNDQLNLSLLAQVPLPDALQDMTWGRQLVEVFRTDFQRQVWLIAREACTMEVVCDQGKVTSAYGEDAISELELELKAGAESGLYQFAHAIAEQVPVQVSVVSKAQKGARLKHGHIEFPDKPKGKLHKAQLAAYWYEVWLVYWEAMFFMKDDVLIQPVRDSMAQLARCLPAEFEQQLQALDRLFEQQVMRLDNEVVSQAGYETLVAFASMKETGLAMLDIGYWLNQQA